MESNVPSGYEDVANGYVDIYGQEFDTDDETCVPMIYDNIDDKEEDDDDVAI